MNITQYSNKFLPKYYYKQSQYKISGNFISFFIIEIDIIIPRFILGQIYYHSIGGFDRNLFLINHTLYANNHDLIYSFLSKIKN